MTLSAPVKTHNYEDLKRYFKYNMAAPIIESTIERRVSDAMEDLQGNNFATFLKFISIGIMLFMICLGGVILLRSLPEGGAAAAPPTTIIGMMFLMWRCKDGKKENI